MSKRLFDIVASLLSLILCAPLMALLALAIRMTSPGPVIYRGLRVGRDGVPFRILKFRTMYTGIVGSAITVADDARVTRVGRVLRATKLDELPQLINVLRGEMSLVGPRPEAPPYLPYYSTEQRTVLAVRPGITGPSQVAFRSEEDLLAVDDPETYYINVLLPAKLAMDVAYVHSHSFVGDVNLVLQTAAAIARPLASHAHAFLAASHPAVNYTHEAVPAQTGVDAPRGWQAAAWQWLDATALLRLRLYGRIVVADIVVVMLAFQTAVVLRFMDSGHAAQQLPRFFLPALAVGLFYAAVAYLFGLHRRLWRYASIRDGVALVYVVVVGMSVVALTDLASGVRMLWTNPLFTAAQRVLSNMGVPVASYTGLHILPIGVVITGALFSVLFLACLKFVGRAAYALGHGTHAGQHVLVVGAGQAGAAFIAKVGLGDTNCQVIACVDDDSSKWGHRIHGVPIVGSVEGIPFFAERYHIDLVVIALPSVAPARLAEVVALCQQTSARIKRVPSVHDLVAPDLDQVRLRDLDVADLLGREVHPVRAVSARTVLEGRTVVVTGAAGSIGSELCQQLLEYGPACLVALDNNETGLFDLVERLQTYRAECDLIPWIGDVTDEHALSQLFTRMHPDIVFHAAAYKHVTLMERHPYQAVRTNILGTYRICRLAEQYGVGRLVFISTDKAAEPVNVYGASKRLGEVIVRAMSDRSRGTCFSVVRFGNVLGSRGSVVPIFTKQIQQGGPVTITDPEATRYFMTIPEACSLVIATCALAGQGELYILDMGEPVRIVDLAERMIRLHGLRVGTDIPILYTRLRPGERSYETLAASSEALVPTDHDKIRRVEHVTSDELPLRASLETWIAVLERHLTEGDPQTLSERVLNLVAAPVQANRRNTDSGLMAVVAGSGE